MSANERTVFNLLHISDLHFGDRFDGRGSEQLSAKLPPLLSRFSHFDGLLGHHYKALTALHDFCRVFWEQKPEYMLVVTGDLTANGSELQFDLAHGFLGSECPESAFNLGLGYDNWMNTSIPGNHDQWPGSNRVLGRPTAGLAKYFQTSFPVVGPRFELRRGLSLRFLFVDSDADVGPFGYNRFFARGDFVSQLSKLRDLLPPPEAGEVRILVIHHSLMPTPPEGDAADPTRQNMFPPALAITNQSRNVVNRFVIEFDIRVILCGHHHVPRLSHLEMSDGTETALVLEARCGTTTQRDKYPYELKIDENRKLAPNTLMLHRILERNQSLFWRTEVFWRNKSGKFVSTSNYSSLLPKHLRTEIRLSPR